MQQLISTTQLTTLERQTYSLPKVNKLKLANRFLNWCHQQEENRFLWLGLSFMGNMGLVLPMTLLTVILASGNNLILWFATCIANVPVLVVNLAAQPTKVTLPMLFAAWGIDLVIVLCSFAIMLI